LREGGVTTTPQPVVERFVPKPVWVDALETRVGRAIPVHPHVISTAKLVVVTPLMAYALYAKLGPLVTAAVFISFATLDALDGVVARAQGLDTFKGRLLDRVCDYPMLIVVGWFSLDVLPGELVVAKLALDALLMLMFVIKGRGTENRIRTTMSDVTVLAILFLTQGFLHAFVTNELVQALLLMNILFSATVGLYNAGVLQKRFIADALSMANALCGCASIWFATMHKPEVCLLLLLVGAGFDGLDGAAARRWGGTRFGVYSDDLADGINYAIAPGVALAFGLSGVEGTVVGVAFSLLTISRLVFFTLNKGNGDPAFFSGVPSTIGGIVALCALILFPERHAIVGLLVGVSVVLMVSFDSAYRHLGRALFGARREKVIVAFVFGVVLLVGGFIWGPRPPTAVVLGLCVAYGFTPQVVRFKRLLSKQADQNQKGDG
jgi:phosphatidylserine synthase